MTIKRGSWVASNTYIGRIRKVNDPIPEYDLDFTYDVVIYDRKGNRVGRVSEPFDGPKNFEPCCDAANWREIEAPEFPLPVFASIDEIVTYKDNA